MLVGEVGNRHLDLDPRWFGVGFRRWKLSIAAVASRLGRWRSRREKIRPPEEIMFVDRRLTIEPVRPKDQIKRFEYSRLASVIVADKHTVLRQEQSCGLNAPEVIYRYPTSPHICPLCMGSP